MQFVPFHFQYTHFYHTPPFVFIPENVSLYTLCNKTSFLVTPGSRGIIMINAEAYAVQMQLFKSNFQSRFDHALATALSPLGSIAN